MFTQYDVLIFYFNKRVYLETDVWQCVNLSRLTMTHNPRYKRKKMLNLCHIKKAIFLNILII